MDSDRINWKYVVLTKKENDGKIYIEKIMKGLSTRWGRQKNSKSFEPQASACLLVGLRKKNLGKIKFKKIQVLYSHNTTIQIYRYREMRNTDDSPLFRYETFINFLTSFSTRGERDTIFTMLTVLSDPTNALRIP